MPQPLEVGHWYAVKCSPFHFYDVRRGDRGQALAVRYPRSSVEACLLRMKRTGEEHWFRSYTLKPVER